jgi:hypothetical protein
MQRKLMMFAFVLSAGARLLAHDGAPDGHPHGQIYFEQARKEKLAHMIPRLFGPTGMVLPNDFHAAHFESRFIEESFTSVNTAIGTQIATLPFASPGSGFVFYFNSALGMYQRSSESFGPVLTERAETIGRRKLYVGFAYQYFSFDKVDGIKLKEFPGVLRHERATGALYEEDSISTVASIDLKMNQFTAVATYGLTDRVDISAAVPFVNARFGLVSSATLQRVAPPSERFGQSHYFDANSPDDSTAAVYAMNNSASGIGDISLRLKWTAFRGERAGVAVAADVRLPTGDELNFLGSGAAGFRPFLAISYPIGRFAPHVNVGYQWNGKSVLAGNVNTGEKGGLPDALTYAAGVDMAATRRITVAADFLGQRLFGATRVVPVTYTDSLGRRFPETRLQKASYDLLSGAIGAKVNLTRTLLLTGNVIFRLNDSGLTAPIVPLIGLSWAF